jgi:hypothetical protein
LGRGKGKVQEKMGKKRGKRDENESNVKIGRSNKIRKVIVHVEM